MSEKPIGYAKSLSLAGLRSGEMYMVPIVSKADSASCIAVYDQSAIDQLEAEIARLKADADRYRWLRDVGAGYGLCDVLLHRREAGEWDESIDSARKAISSEANGESPTDR
jgi:hypothetical protein